MAREFVGASSQYLESTIAALQPLGQSFVISLWFRPTSAPTAAETLFGCWEQASSSWGYTVQIDGTASGDPVRLGVKTGSATYTFAPTANGTTAGQWNHVLAVSHTATNRIVYLNGDTVNAGSNTVSKVVTSTMTRTAIGRESDLTPGLYFNGRIADVAIWTASAFMDNDTVRALSQGASPLLIWPSSLVNYWPLHGSSPEIDRVGRVDLTVNGATVAAGPRLTRPSSGSRFPFVTGVGPTIYPLTIGGTLSMAGAVTRRADKVLVASLTPAGGLVRQPFRSFSSTFGLAGTLRRAPERTYTGILNSAGVVARAPAKSMPSTLPSSGALLSRLSLIRAYAGTLPTAGSLARMPAKIWAGTAPSAGALVRVPATRVAGTLVGAGAVARVPAKVMASAVGFSGLVQFAAGQSISMAGVLPIAGALIRTPVKVAAAAIALAGVLREVVTPVAYTGALPSAGALTRLPVKPVSGTLPLTGALQRIGSKTAAVVGAIPITGALIRIPVKPAAAAVALTGALIRVLSPVIAPGTFTLTGGLKRVPVKPLASLLPLSGVMQTAGGTAIALAGTLALSGTLLSIPAKLLAGTLAFTRTLGSVPVALYAGVLDATSTLGTDITKLFTRELTPTGTVTSGADLILEFSRELTPTGALASVPHKLMSAVLGMTGRLVREPQKPHNSVLPMEGSLQQDVAVVFEGELAMAGHLAPWQLSHTMHGLIQTGSGLVDIVILRTFTRVLTLAGTLATTAGVKFVELVGSLDLSGALVGRDVTKQWGGTLGFSGILTQLANLTTRIGSIRMVRMLLRSHGAVGPKLTDESTLEDEELN